MGDASYMELKHQTYYGSCSIVILRHRGDVILIVDSCGMNWLPTSQRNDKQAVNLCFANTSDCTDRSCSQPLDLRLNRRKASEP